VELDDSSHEAPHRQQRDALVNEVLRTVGVPLLRVPVKRSYVPREIAADIRSAIRG
jgi:very-short-patch-repair endonuclease